MTRSKGFKIAWIYTAQNPSKHYDFIQVVAFNQKVALKRLKESRPHFKLGKLERSYFCHVRGRAAKQIEQGVLR